MSINSSVECYSDEVVYLKAEITCLMSEEHFRFGSVGTSIVFVASKIWVGAQFIPRPKEAVLISTQIWH